MKFRRSRVRAGSLVGAFALLVGVIATGPPAQATSTLAYSIAPAAATPEVSQVGGGAKITSMAQVGNLIVAVGSFDHVLDKVRGLTLARSSVVAFDANTGQVSDTFAPIINGTVATDLAAPDGTSVFVGGNFTTVNGVAALRLVKLSVATGAVVTAFKATVGGPVRDLDITGNRLFLAGGFKVVDGIAQDLLAEVDATTGAISHRLAVTYAGIWATVGSPGLFTLDISAAGDRLVTTGNFQTVNGAVHTQIALFSITPTGVTLNPWRATAFETRYCSTKYNHYVMDAEFAPAGDYLVTVDDGGAGQSLVGLCDAAARWDVALADTGVQPVWTQYSGGDSFTAVEVTSGAVYLGGQERWLNNPQGRNSAGPGAVDVRGLAAVDPDTGQPAGWAPAGTLGVGIYDLLPTAAGLYVGSSFTAWAKQSHVGLVLFPTIPS